MENPVDTGHVACLAYLVAVSLCQTGACPIDMNASSGSAKQPPSPPAPEREPYMGLRLRLWLACISGGAVAGLGSLWVLGTHARPEAGSPPELLAWLAGVAFAAVAIGLALALWLDHHIVGHLRGLLRGLSSGRVSELRGLPSAAGWGELSELGEVAQAMLGRQRLNIRAVDDLELVRTQISALQAAIERWLQHEHWESPELGPGPLTDTNEALGRGFARRALVDEQNLQAARQVAEELAAGLADAQESAEQAERGFVEATAMLTTVRELQRLSGELQNSLGAVGGAAMPADDGATRAALEDLVQSSQASVEAIGRGMIRVQDVSELVHQLANRATLVAIHAVSGGRASAAGEDDDVALELKQLVHDVREATDRTAQFANEIEAAVAEAGQRMHAARERALARLEERTPAAPALAGSRAYDDSQRLLERVREMVQDAARKGERLSAAGERASRAAERLSRRVNEETSEAQALALRLQPVGAAATHVAPAPEARELWLLPGSGIASDAPVETTDDAQREEERP